MGICPIQATQASVKRRSALLESNRPRDSRRARLQTRSLTAGLPEAARRPPVVATSCFSWVVSARCLKKLPQGPERSDGPEDAGCRRHPASTRPSGGVTRSRACLIACESCQFDAPALPPLSIAFMEAE